MKSEYISSQYVDIGQASSGRLMFPQRFVAEDTASRYRSPIFDCVIQGYAKIYRIYKYLQGFTRL